MRLKSIKLAGFKSFVDPTTVGFPSNMAAVVGPNGCGKSNIIDAVRWVMGESSAKNLRGESMTDVIFNGSNTRKPVTQASIELIFDNSDGTLTGEYAAYAEISIRRRVTRDGQNTYFLNGAKCRRRDITDIFLGTGLGPRSYSIIEQGMISRLIEAKPEDLRHFIEEAAGISKYKERRRETELRIRRTQENLARLSDLREELERQLERLQRQAQAAEKYQQYKAEERQLRAQLTAMRWQTLNGQVEACAQRIGEQEIACEAALAEQRNADARIEQLRDRHHDLSEAFNQAQARFYAVSGDIARLEQSIGHGQQRLRQLQNDLREVERVRQESVTHQANDQARLVALNDELEQLEPELALAEAAAEEAVMRLEAAETAMRLWQDEWERFNQHSDAPRRSADVQQARIQQLQQNLERLGERQRRQRDEHAQLSGTPEETSPDALAETLAIEEQAQEALLAADAQAAEHLEQVRDALLEASRGQQQAQGALQRLQGRIASLEALQQAALNPDTDVSDWLDRQGLAHPARLAEALRVQPGWECAVETVLGADLHAIVLPDFTELALDTLERGELHLASPASPHTGTASTGTLLDKVDSPYDLSPWLGQVHPVESLADALAARSTLAPHRSLISREGYWVGRHFLRVRRGTGQEAGLLARSRELEHLQKERKALDAELTRRETHLAELRERQRDQESQREAQRQSQRQLAHRLGELKAQLSARRARAEQLQLRRAALDTSLAELAEQQMLETEQIEEARLLLQEAQASMSRDSEQRDRLQARRERLRETLDSARQESRQQQEQAHRLAMRANALHVQRESIHQALERLQLQLAHADERSAQLSLDLEENTAPLEALHRQLEEQLERRFAIDEALTEARRAQEDADQALREAERRRSQAEQQGLLLRGQLEQQRLAWQALLVQRTTLEEQLKAEGHDLGALLDTLPAEAAPEPWENALASVAGRIQRLGAINLAAIDEYRQQSERKRYLDAQNDDLSEALSILENVIRKIDRETRNRFKDTFERIDAGLRTLFPKVFGGGTAYLELTGEDLLDTGVAIMARPPGKKNSTIHLLSGGEKALTALALVFAIFQLNPAPFCMLDEVDAPLDDANVGRYARLVKEMSEKVQFIYITHNKIAMEMADQLMGVTMHEPGCSRLVAVDMERAMELVES